MMKKILRFSFIVASLVTCFLFPRVADAQASKAAIKGSAKDSASGKGIDYATAGLYRLTDQNKAVKNIFTNSKGEFAFTGVDTGTYVVIISHTNFSEKISAPLSVTNTSNPETQTVNLVLTQAVKQLADVTVTGSRRPLVERQEDKLIFNAESDPTLDGQQATDVLRKTPFLSVDNDGNVLLNGQSNFKILLNGKESSMFAKDPKEVLKSFPANLIKKIEVITQPSAKYDAEGIGGIINIITKKSILGYNASISTYVNNTGNKNINTNINLKYGKLGISSYFGYGGNNNPPLTRSENVTFSTDPIAYKERILKGSSANKWDWMNTSNEISYDIDSLNTISSYLNGYGGSSKSAAEQQSFLVLPTNDTTKGTYNSQSDNRYPSFDWGADYIRKFKDKPNKEFSLRFNGSNSINTSINNSQQLQTGFQRYALTNDKDRNNQYTIQADLVLPMKNKQKLEMGLKTILRNANANYDGLLSYQSDGKYIPDPTNTNIFNYYQHIYGAYATYGFNIKNVFAKLGVRAEKSELGGSFQTGNTTIKESFFNVVPTVFLSKSLKNNQTVTFNYSIRLQRPYIWDLNPLVNNTDSLNIRYGNPNLKPQIIHNIEFGYSMFKGSNSISLKLSGFYSNNKITQYSIFDPATGITATTSDNIGRNYGTTLSGYMSVKPLQWWTINTNLGISYNMIFNKYNTSISNRGISGNANFNTTMDVNKKLAASFNAGMWQGGISLQQKQGMYYWYGTGASLKMMNNKIRLTLLLSNFLTKEILTKSTISGENFYGYQKNYGQARSIGFSVRWNFGKLTENTSKKKGVDNDDLKK